MAKLVIKNPVVTINSVDLSDHISSITLQKTVNEVTTTAFGDNGVTRIGGLEDNSITLSFQEDYAATEVYATINPLVGSTTTVTVKPVNTTTSSTNPAWSMTVLVTEWPLINGAVGDLATADITWPVSGVITTSTT